MLVDERAQVARPRFRALLHPGQPPELPDLQRQELSGLPGHEGKPAGHRPRQLRQPRGLPEERRPRRALPRPVQRHRSPQGPGRGGPDLRAQEYGAVQPIRLRPRRYAALPALYGHGLGAAPEHAGRRRDQGRGHALPRASSSTRSTRALAAARPRTPKTSSRARPFPISRASTAPPRSSGNGRSRPRSRSPRSSWTAGTPASTWPFSSAWAIVPMGVEPLDFRQDASFDEAVEWIGDARRLVGAKDRGLRPRFLGPRFRQPGPAPRRGVRLEGPGRRAAPAGRGRFHPQGPAPGPGQGPPAPGLLPPVGAVPGLGQDRAIRAGRSAGPSWPWPWPGSSRPKRTSSSRGPSARRARERSRSARISSARRCPLPPCLASPDDRRETTFASKLTLLGGENVRWIEREGEVAYLEVFYPPNSNVLDRSSRFNRWQVRKTRQELEALVNQSYPIGGSSTSTSRPAAIRAG